MSNSFSIKQLAEKFWKLEQKLNLLQFDINGVNIWQYQRHRIFLILSQQVGLFTQAHTKKNNFKELLLAAPSLLYYSVFSNPLTGNYQKDILVFSSGRKVKVDGQFIDIYSEYLVRELQQDSYEIIEELYLNKHLPGERKNRKHQDVQQVTSFLKSKLSRFRFSGEQSLFISEIENEIKHELGVKIDLKTLFYNGYLMFKYDFEFYDRLLIKRKPKQIYLVCSYVYKLALIAAAKKNGVETIEIQHGTIDKFHVAYSYPNQKSIDYFPDKIYFFGEYWKNAAPIPLKEENKVVFGFPFFNEQKKKYDKIAKKVSTILIISQGTIGDKLSEFIWESREILKDFSIIYKLHPGEYDRWKADYPYLVKLSELENVSVIDNSKTNIYEFLAESEFVIGVYSTAIYEALSFDCKVILVDLSGIEYLEDIIEKGFVKLAETSHDLRDFIVENKFKKFNSDLFFASDIKLLIEKI